MSSSRISRSDFLKFLASGSVFFTLGLLGLNSLFDPKKNRATGQSVTGSWDPPTEQPTGTTSVHAALLAGGKVLWIQGSANHDAYLFGPFKHGIWNPDGSFTDTTVLAEDLFCCGMATLANGNVLLSGGTYLDDGPLGSPRASVNGKFAGGWFAYEAEFSSGSIGKRSVMKHGRWYPTCVELPDGKVCVMQGLDEYGMNNRLVEFYDPDNQSWTIRLDPAGNNTWCAGQTQEAYDFSPLPPAGSQCYGPGTAPYITLYPRMHLMPSGLLSCVGMGDTDRMYDPNTYKWVFAKSSVVKRHYGTSVLCPLRNTLEEKGKILLAGGSPEATAPSTNTCEIAEPSGTNGITRRSIASMTYGRKHADPVLLPTGEIVIFGGNLQQTISPQLLPEVFDPWTETWQIWSSATVPRMYHQVSILLHDGRVWTAGTTPNTTSFEKRIEIFNPWYVSETRPVISGEPTVGGYGETITIPTTDAPTITKVSLLKQSSATHHYNTDQRLIWLQILSSTDSTVTVRAPLNNKLAPPGMYLLHVLNDAIKPVPSVAWFVKIPGTGAAPPPDLTPPGQVTALAASAISSTQISLSWNQNNEADLNHYNIYRGTEANFVVVPGVDQPLAQPTTNSYADTGLLESTTYYYRVAAVDVAGNIGQLSDEQSATTGVGGYVAIYSVAGSNNYVKLYSGNVKRAGELMFQTSSLNSIMIAQPVKKVKVILKKSGSPSGSIDLVVRNSAGAIVHTFGTIDPATLSSSDQSFEREASSSYTLAANDRILVEWDGTGLSTDQVWVKRTSSDTNGGFDGYATKWTQYKTSYSNQSHYDLAGEWFKLT